MNRRAFFISFAKTIATVAVAQQLVRNLVLDVAASAPLTLPTKLVLNPEYAKAKYEFMFYRYVEGEGCKELLPVVYNREDKTSKICIPPKGMAPIKESWPIRMNEDKKVIHPFIQYKDVI